MQVAMQWSRAVQIVYAYLDQGEMSATRWRPRRIDCTEQADHSDKPGVEHVVKLCQGAKGAAAMISEVLCAGLLDFGGLRTLERRLVSVSVGFAASYHDSVGEIASGFYFGTVRKFDVENGPPPSLSYVAAPQELIDIWVFDSWFGNIDREIDGNILMEPAKGGKFSLVAADNSDCFGGSGRFDDGSWKQVLKQNQAASSADCLQGAILECGGAQSVESAIEKVRTASLKIDGALADVPTQWWKMVKFRPEEIKDVLLTRARSMEAIVKLELWKGIKDATNGGIILF